MKNRFIIITTCYNVEPYIQLNVYVNKFQTYDNALFVYVDDKSTDTTHQTLLNISKDDSRFLVLQNDNNGSQGKAYMYAVDYLTKHSLINDEDIIVEVDGDDWLSSPFVLEYLNEIYKSSDVWMTHGQYQIYPDGVVGGHYQAGISDNVDHTNTGCLIR